MQVLFPRTTKELQTLLVEIPQGRIMAGGTDLLVKLRQSGQQIPAVFCLEQLAALQQTGWQQDEFCIGAAVTQQQLLDNAVIRTEYCGLYQALNELASPPIRTTTKPRALARVSRWITPPTISPSWVANSP